MGKEVATTGNKSLFASLQKTTAVAGTGDIAPIEIKESGVNYVGFYTNKATKAVEIATALPGIQPGNAYLYEPNKGYTRLSNFRFHLLNRTRHWVQRDNQNKPVRVVTTDPGDMYGLLKENFETVILVYKDDGTVVPAMCTFNTAKAKVGQVAEKTLAKVQTPDWFNLSPDHKLTAEIPIPAYRFVMVVNSYVKPSKTGGFPTVHAIGTPKPTSMADLMIVDKSSQSEEFQATLASTVSAWKTRGRDLDELATKS